MNNKTVILDRAAELLALSTNGDVSTRAVCEAAGVTQPVLYRIFGDKDGLLAAVVDHVWEQYLSMKRAATPHQDPLTDLYAGWDSHVDFALEHPHAYRLLFGTNLTTTPGSGAEALRLLRVNLERLAAQGRLRLTPEEATGIVMAANSGVALALILRPEENPDRALSTRLRDTLYASLLVENSTAADSGPFIAATTLKSALPEAEAEGTLSPGESALLNEWLTRLQRRHSPS